MIPGRLEREATQYVIDELADLLDPPPCPCPDLRRDIIEYGDTSRLRLASEPPVKPRIVDQDYRVGTVIPEIAVGAANQAQKLVQVEEDPEEPHHGHLDQREEDLRPGLFHPRATVA